MPLTVCTTVSKPRRDASDELDFEEHAVMRQQAQRPEPDSGRRQRGSQQDFVVNVGGRRLFDAGVVAARRLIAFTKQTQGRFAIGIMRTDGSGERILTEGYHNEGPTWSPNRRVIMFFRDPRR